MKILFSVPTQVYDFKKLDQLELFDFKRDDQNRAVRKIVDIVAIVQTAGELSSILIKSQGKDLEKVSFVWSFSILAEIFILSETVWSQK